MIASPCRSIRRLALAAAVVLVGAGAAHAQRGYFASIAYSQSTGKIGFSAGRARTKDAADSLAIRSCDAADAKVWMWARDQWVAIAVVEGHRGSAGFGRGRSADEAQRRALEECSERASGHPYRVALCVHGSGQRVRDEQLRRVAGKPVVSATGYFAALAFSPSTGKIGSTAGKAKTIEEAKQLALADCNAKDAKVFMWGDKWIAVAVAPDRPGVAGFGPGATRAAAEKAALDECTKYAKGAPCRVALAIYSTGEEPQRVDPASRRSATAQPPTSPSR